MLSDLVRGKADPNLAGRNTSNDRVRGYVVDDHCTSGHDGSAPDRGSRQYDRAEADPGVALDDDLRIQTRTSIVRVSDPGRAPHQRADDPIVMVGTPDESHLIGDQRSPPHAAIALQRAVFTNIYVIFDDELMRGLEDRADPNVHVAPQPDIPADRVATIDNLEDEARDPAQ